MHSDDVDKGNDRTSASGIPQLHIGSRLLADAYAGDGSLLLRAGLSIDNEWDLQRLVMPDVRFGRNRSKVMPIDMAAEAGIGLDPDQELDVKILRANVTRAYGLKAEVVQDVAEVFSRIESLGAVEAQRARTIVSSLLDDMIQDPRALVSLTQLKSRDAYTFTHSVNVSILSIYLAIQCGLVGQMESIGIAALLHDAGKMKIPMSILNKRGALTEAEMAVMRDHSRIGYHIVNAPHEFEPAIPLAVLDHHEKVDGSGYPSRKSDDMIGRFARIIAIADVYDALTTTRPYHEAMDPRNAMLLMTRKISRGFDPVYLERFAVTLGCYPVGSQVWLSDGTRAIVARVNPSDPLHPAVALMDEAGTEFQDAPAIDLRDKQGLCVEGFAGEYDQLPLAA